MFENKYQIIRYNTLDKCFQNFGKEYSIEDLLDAVNEVLSDYSSSSIQLRQLRKDIAFMRSSAGYDAPIETIKGDNGYYYRYDDKNFSINKSPLNKTEAEQLKNAVSILQRFQGSPEFEWVNEIAPILNDKFDLKNVDKKAIELEANDEYSGYKYITPLFNAIINKTVLRVDYKTYDGEEFEIIFHPYLLKQYNNRWFVLGYNEYNQHSQWNLALDRIQKTPVKSSEKYKEDTTNWNEHFKDIIGVTNNKSKVYKIKLWFSDKRIKYVQTKPLHNSWDEIEENGQTYITIDVQINNELIQKLLSFGKDVKVIEPEILKSKMREHVKELEKYY